VFSDRQRTEPRAGAHSAAIDDARPIAARQTDPKEHQMNRELQSTSPLIRAIFAVASLLVSILVVGSMTSLADHYNAESQLASAQRAIVAQR
jgi:hypothetical protein